MPIYGTRLPTLEDYEFQSRVMGLWRSHGGGQHGPMVETVTMPLDKFRGFVGELRHLVESMCVETTAAERDVIAERRRQVEVEGWTAKHDDEHTPGAMARAAASYAWAASLHVSTRIVLSRNKGWFLHVALRQLWPGWAHRWFKPTTPRQDLVKAAALALAEIERIDRAAAKEIGA